MKYRLLFFLLPIAVLFAVTGIVMGLWNILLPEILGVKPISYWQAMGILVLSKILFGGFHSKPGKCSRWKERKLQHRMEQFSEEDKERFRQKMKERFGNSPFCRK